MGPLRIEIGLSHSYHQEALLWLHFPARSLCPPRSCQHHHSAGMWWTSPGNWSIATFKIVFLSRGSFAMGPGSLNSCTTTYTDWHTEWGVRDRNAWVEKRGLSLTLSRNYISSVTFIAVDMVRRNVCNDNWGWEKAAHWRCNFLLLCSWTDGADTDFLILLLSLWLQDACIYCSMCRVAIYVAEIAFPCISSAWWFFMAILLCLLQRDWFHSVNQS